MNDRPWYKRYASNFITGTIALSLEEKGAYAIFLDLLYDHREPIEDNDAWIARACGCSTRKWRAIRARLIDLQKIVVLEGGKLTNRRFDREMEIARKEGGNDTKESRKTSENSSKTSRKQAENEPKSPPVLSENNHLTEDILEGRGKREDISASEAESESSAARVIDEAFRMWSEAEKKTPHIPEAYPTPSRASNLGKVLDCIGGLNGWERLIEKLSCSEYFAARIVTGWRPGIDWVLLEANYPKILEGHFDRLHERRPGPPTGKPLEPLTPAPNAEREMWENRIRQWREKQFWHSSWGPKPGDPHCEAPRNLLIERTEAAE